MKQSILDGKVILAADDDPDVLQLLEEKILRTCPGCKLDKVTTYHEAAAKLLSSTYDLVLLDVMGVRGFDLLEIAVQRNLPAAMLAPYPPNPDAMKRSIEMGARSYLLKGKLEEIVPTLEDVLTYEYLPGWKRVLQRMKDQVGNAPISWDTLAPVKIKKKK